MKKAFLLFLISFSLILFNYNINEIAKANAIVNTENFGDIKLDSNTTDNNSFYIKYDVRGAKDSGSIDLWVKGKNMKMFIINTDKYRMSESTMYVVDSITYFIFESDTTISGFKIKTESNDKQEFVIYDIKQFLKYYQKIGTDEVLGYKCDVYQTKKGLKISVYNELSVLKILDKEAQVIAIVFNPDILINDDFFIPPSDINFIDFSKMLDSSRTKNDFKHH